MASGKTPKTCALRNMLDKSTLKKPRDWNLVEQSHVPFLCAKLEEAHGFSDKELQQVPSMLENCQYRPYAHEFLLRLKHSSNNFRAVDGLAKELRTRLSQSEAVDVQGASAHGQAHLTCNTGGGEGERLQVIDYDSVVKPVLKYLKESEKQVQESVAPADEDLLSQKADFETTLRILKRPKMSTSAKTIADITGDLDEVQQSIQSQLDARVQQDMREGIAKVIQDVRTMIKSNFVYAADVV